jgi:hypothetical protein
MPHLLFSGNLPAMPLPPPQLVNLYADPLVNYHAAGHRVVGVFPSVASYLRLTICYLIEYSEDWENERSYIREDKVLGSLDRLHELMAQAVN